MNAKAVHLAYLDTIKNRDLDALRKLLHADYVYMGGDGEEHKGADHGVEVAQTYLTAFPDMTIEIRSQYVPSETVSIVEMVGRGTHAGELQGIPPTNRTVEVPVCNVIEVRDGKIVREHEYFDTMAMLQQLGVAEGP